MKASEKIPMGSLPYVLIIASVVLSVHLLNSNSMAYAR